MVDVYWCFLNVNVLLYYRIFYEFLINLKKNLQDNSFYWRYFISLNLVIQWIEYTEL